MLIIFLCYTLYALPGRILESSNHKLRYDDYIYRDQAPKEHYHELVFAIKQKNLDLLEDILYDVSIRTSSQYGKHKSFDEIGRLVENKEGAAAIVDWLKANDITISSRTVYAEYIGCNATIEKWESLFSTTFFAYERIGDHDSTILLPTMGKKLFYRAETITLPDDIVNNVHTVFYAVHLPPRQSPRRSFESISIDDSKTTDSTQFSIQAALPPNAVNPWILKSLYGIYGDGNSTGSQAVYERDSQTFYESDITLFQKTFNLSLDYVDKYVGTKPNPSVCSSVINNCIESSLDLQYIMSIGKSVPTTYYHDSNTDKAFLQFLIDLSNNPSPANIYSISYTVYEVEVSVSQQVSFDIEAMKLGARGVTLIVAAGDDGVTGYKYPNPPYTSCGYYASWPASSAYVTALGGTMNGYAITKSPEIALSSATGSRLTTGGGFSNNRPMPKFQRQAIADYVSKYKAPQSSIKAYNSSNRGYPDLSLAANRYAVAIKNAFYSVSGTSAAAPVFAGMVALVNSRRIAKGLTKLGWLNPSIYSSNGSFANDIVSGDNYCANVGVACCSIGFNTTTSWDPVTGFGSVNFPEFLQYYVDDPVDLPPSQTYHYGISFHVIQTFSSEASASEISQDLTAKADIKRILLNLFLSLDILAVSVNAISSSSLLSTLASTQDVQIDYSLSFERYLDESELDSALVNLRYDITTIMSAYITSGNFTQALASSKSLLTKMTSTIAPLIPQPELEVITTSSSSNSHSSTSIPMAATIAIAIGGVAIFIGIGVALLYRVRYIRKSRLLMEDFGIIDTKVTYSMVINDPLGTSTRRAEV